ARYLEPHQHFMHHGKWYRRIDDSERHIARAELKEYCWVGAYTVPGPNERSAPIPVSFNGGCEVWVEVEDV
ncbi:MAG: hypothetical protein AMJ55_00250, partial [Gammaproteobacteria bacterium SG8_15]